MAGFADRDLDQLLGLLEPERDPDKVPPPPAVADSQPGEVFQLGEHRLLCGDASDPELIAAFAAGTEVGAVWTDPPYGVDYEGKTERRLRIRNDNLDAPALLERTLLALAPVLSAHAPFYLCAPGGRLNTQFRLVLERTGWRLHEDLLWVKQQFVLGRLDYHAQHEHVLYGWAPGTSGRPGRGSPAGSRWHGDNRQSSVFFVDRPTRSEEHPTIKPVGLITAHLLNSTRRGDWVIDPFAGSGSTLIACEQLARRCLAVELDPVYCDVIRDRYTEYTRGPA